MNLPREILIKIFRFLGTEEKLNCLTVCKQWLPSVEDGLYTEVCIFSFHNFMYFVKQIKRHRFSLGSKVTILRLKDTMAWNLDRDRGSIEAAEANLHILAKYCINLKELDFDSPVFWIFLVLIEWKETWLKLTKIPAYDTNLTTTVVYEKLRHRLTSTKFVLPQKATNQTVDLLLSMRQLESLELDQENYLNIRRENVYSMDPVVQGLVLLDALNNRRLFRIHLLKDIMKSFPNLKYLSIKCPIADLFTSSAVLPSLPFLKSISCHILHPKSAWFPIIKSNFCSMIDLELNITITTVEGSDVRAYTRQLTHLYEHMKVNKSSLSFDSTALTLCINNFLRPIIRKTDCIEPIINISMSIYDKEALTNSIEETCLITNTQKNRFNKEKYTVNHDIHLQCILDTDKVNEVKHLDDMFGVTFSDSNGSSGSPLDNTISLKLKRIILENGQQYTTHIDQILLKFPQLQHLTISSKNVIRIEHAPRFLNSEESSYYSLLSPVQQAYYEGYYYKVEIFSNEKGITHQNLVTLSLEHMCFEPNMLSYLHEMCPSLEYIKIIDCTLIQDETYTKIQDYTSLMIKKVVFNS